MNDDAKKELNRQLKLLEHQKQTRLVCQDMSKKIREWVLRLMENDDQTQDTAVVAAMLVVVQTWAEKKVKDYKNV